MFIFNQSPWAGSNRGLGVGHFWSFSGELLATVIQESLTRLREDLSEDESLSILKSKI